MLLRRGVHIYENNIIIILLGVHAFEILFQLETTKSSYVWSVDNSQRAIDNAQTVARPLSQQNEDL